MVIFVRLARVSGVGSAKGVFQQRGGLVAFIGMQMASLHPSRRPTTLALSLHCFCDAVLHGPVAHTCTLDTRPRIYGPIMKLMRGHMRRNIRTILYKLHVELLLLLFSFFLSFILFQIFLDMMQVIFK